MQAATVNTEHCIDLFRGTGKIIIKVGAFSKRITLYIFVVLFYILFWHTCLQTNATECYENTVHNRNSAKNAVFWDDAMWLL
jgi:hypothetical protein